MDFDVIVIGAGPGGYVSAIEAAHNGLKTAIVEKKEVGGTCLNRGCIPTKALLHSAELYKETKNAAKFGIGSENTVFDFGAMHEYKAGVVTKLRTGVESLFAANGVTLIRGEAKITSKGVVEVSGEKYTADNIVIATGSVPARPPIPGLDLDGVLTSDDLLEGSPEFTGRLAIIGGGVIGVEFATVYSSLGAEVTVIEAMDRLIPVIDREASQNLSMILKKRGVKVNCSSMVKKVEKNEDGSLKILYESKGRECEAAADKVLVAIGRRAYSLGLFDESLGIEVDRGRIITDENFETSIKGIYAVGDVTSRVQLAHSASAQGIFVADRIAGKENKAALDLIPSCIYVSPEIAETGLNEDAAKEKGIAVRIGKVTMYSNGKTLISDSERGFIKIIAEEKTLKILGAVMMCERATDMISLFTEAIANSLTAGDLRKGMYPHPTFSEAIGEALEALDGTPIHTAPPRKR